MVGFRNSPNLCKVRSRCVLPPSYRQTRTENLPAPRVRTTEGLPRWPGVLLLFLPCSDCFLSQAPRFIPSKDWFGISRKGSSLPWEQRDLQLITICMLRAWSLERMEEKISVPSCGGWRAPGRGEGILGTTQLQTLLVPLYRSGNWVLWKEMWLTGCSRAGWGCCSDTI